MIHNLKTDPGVFEQTAIGNKPWEIRLNDRNFKVGDYVLLLETKYSGEAMRNGKPLVYTGREYKFQIRYIMHGPAYGLKMDWVIMS